MGGRRDLDQVAAGRGLAARQVDLEHAEAGGLAKHPRPRGGIELIARADRAPADWSNRDSRAGSGG